MRKISKILLALAACFVLTGIAAADAGDTWNTATTFDCDDTYNFVEESVSSSDEDDYWKSYDPDVGDELDLLLNSEAFRNDVTAIMLDGDHDVMGQVSQPFGNYANDDTLDTTQVYLHLMYGGIDSDYTAVIINADA